MDSNFRNMLEDIQKSDAQNLLIRHEARKLLNFAKELDSRATYLQKQRQTKLDALEQRREHLKQDVFRVVREIQTLPETARPGVVSAICYDPKDAFCMIDGVDRVLKQADVIDTTEIKNVRVLNMHRDRVEFERDGQTWTQTIGALPDPAWNQPK